MKERGQGSPEGAAKSQTKPKQLEQHPPSGDITKPELHPPKEMPLARGLNLPGHKQQTGDLDSEAERLMRAYANAEAEGDPKKAERLFKRYMKNSFLREWFKNGARTTPLAYGPHPPKED
jgi:hypothetical protein